VAPHPVGPLAKRNFTGFGLSVNGKPLDDGIGLLWRWFMAASDVRKPFSIAQYDTAGPVAIPEAGLGLDCCICASISGKPRLHMADQGLAARPSVRPGFAVRRIAACCT
jgi:hypothetical protein